VIPGHNAERSSSAARRRPWGGLFQPPEFYRERTDEPIGFFEAIFEPIVLVFAIVLFSQGLVQFGRVVAPGWNVDGLVLMAGVAAVAGYLYSRRLARGAVIWREWIVLLAPMVLLSRFLPYLTEPGTSLAADLAAWTIDPGGFFEAGWIVRAGVIVGAWATAFYSTQDLNAVRVQRGEIPDTPARTIIERAWEGERNRSIDHTWPLRRLAARFLQGGVAMILLAALTSTAETQSLGIGAALELFSFARPSSAVALVNVVAYFVAVLLLLIEAQYARNRTLWLLDRAQIAESVPKRWATTGVVIVAVGLLAALLAPTEQLLGFGDVLHVLIGAAFYVAQWFMVGLFLLFWIVTYPLRLLMPNSGDVDVPAAPQIPPSIAPAGEDGTGVIRSLLFWLIVGGVALYSLWALWREREHGRFGAVLRLVERLGRAVWRLLAFLWRVVSGTARTVGDAARRLLPTGAAGDAARRARAWAAGVLPGRDPRRIVLALYAMMSARAAQQGLERRAGQTASEYGLRLREGLPDVSPEVEGLTEAFLRARYSRHEIGASDAGVARRAWGRIRGQLRHLRGSR
jgi:hypothetical protein